MESQEPVKKDPPVFERSVMLTRFKLSQQKRKLREKDNEPTITQALKKSPKSSTKKQKQSPIKNKEKSQLNGEKNEFYPNKLKRNKIVNKIVLKPKNDLKVINWNDVKRKSNQMNIKSQNKKRKKGHKQSTSDTNEDISSSEYSELDFDEVIRMADQDLDDEDLMEILTCPSPVWWEEPPDDKYMEGPIVIRTNTLESMPDLASEYRRKQARKRKPQKIIIEKEECKTNKSIENSLQSNIINKTSDVKFNNKREKLEDLLNTMKAKRKELKNTDISKDIENKGVSEEIKIEKDESAEAKSEVIDTTGDSTYLDISLYDNDILKHLENIKIPIEDIEQKVTNEKITDSPKRKIYKHRVFYTKKSKNIQKNKKAQLKVIDIKKLTRDMKSLEHIRKTKIPIQREKKLTKNEKSLEHIKNTKISTPQEKKETESEKVIIKDEKNDYKKSLETFYNDRKNNDLSNQVIPLKIKEENVTNDNEEYITVFEIINSDDETVKNLESSKTDIKTEKKTEISSIDEIDKHKLNSYYKKCKKSTKKTKNKSQKTSNNVKKMEKGKKVCNDCNLDTKNSIIVPSTNDIKYCLKCSSIFDADSCSYCIKKEENQKESI